jgi:TonB family protein
MFMQFANLFTKMSVVLIINVSLFLLMPVSQHIFQIFDQHDKAVEAPKKIIAEYVKTKQQDNQPKQKSQLRTVSTSEAQPMQSTMKMKFTPDLSVGASGDGVALQGQQLETEVFEEGDVDVLAAPRFQPQPPYPDKARELAIEGEVAVSFVVDADGSVASIRSLQTPHPSFDKEVRQTISQWKFSPAMKKGVPVKSVMSIVLEYGLD